jgi:hypothetical protein
LAAGLGNGAPNPVLAAKRLLEPAAKLARFGYSRHGRRERPQIVIGLLCPADGCPVAVAVFEGDVADPLTLGVQIAKLKKRFRLRRVVLVGDRGLVTKARIETELKPAGLDWITSLRAPAIRRLLEDGPLQLSLFDERDLAEIDSPDYPGERLIVGKNPLLAAERGRKRDARSASHPGAGAARPPAAQGRRRDRPGRRRRARPAQGRQAFPNHHRR